MKKRGKIAALMLVTSLIGAELGSTWVMAYAAQDSIDMPEAELVSCEESKEAYPEDLVYYESADPRESDEIIADKASQVQTAEGVTEEMCEAKYWNDKNTGSGIDADRLLIDKDEINSLNKAMLDAHDTNMYDLENMADTYNAAQLKSSLAAGTVPTKDAIYVDQVAVDPKGYYKEVADAIEATGYTDESRENQYAVAVKRTTVTNIPVSAYIGYTATDSDDEKAVSALLVGEPFIIRQKATVFGNDFYWGYSDICTGWVAAGDLAICSDKAEWLDAWKIDAAKDDFIVVTQNQITLEPSISKPELSEVKLTFSTILKTVPDDKIPESIAERGPWNNYVVYLPVRDSEGKYLKGIALISQHYEVSRGYLDMTQAEILRVAFNNLGDRYGWGGMLDSMDCSLFTKNVYRCFGLKLPRNTTWQQALPGRKIDLSAMSDEEKLSAMNRMPAGTLFYLPGHTMMYTGTVRKDGKDMAYVISDSGSLSDATGELKVRSMYSVILNPLTVRRRNGTTWVKNITAAVLPISEACVELVRKNIETQKPGEEVSMNRVSAAEGQAYASSKDTLPLETFLGNTQDIYISFCNVEGSGAKELSATVIKGSRITSKVPVSAVRYDKGVATSSIKKVTGLATVTMKKSGKVSFDMADGKTYDVYFTVDSPKARTAAVKAILKEAKEGASDTVVLDTEDLFGSRIDGGMLSIENQKGNSASVFDNKLMIDPKVKNTVKISNKYLNKKYTLTITVN